MVNHYSSAGVVLLCLDDVASQFFQEFNGLVLLCLDDVALKSFRVQRGRYSFVLMMWLSVFQEFSRFGNSLWSWLMVRLLNLRAGFHRLRITQGRITLVRRFMDLRNWGHGVKRWVTRREHTGEKLWTGEHMWDKGTITGPQWR